MSLRTHVVLVATFLAVLPRLAFGQACPDSPSFDAQPDEKVAAKSEQFVEHCPPLVLERFFPDSQPNVVGFSRSPRWGDIARIDVRYPGKSERMRFVCFKNDQASKMRWVTYDVGTKTCSASEQHPGYWTIYPPLSGQSQSPHK